MSGWRIIVFLVIVIGLAGCSSASSARLSAPEAVIPEPAGEGLPLAQPPEPAATLGRPAPTLTLAAAATPELPTLPAILADISPTVDPFQLCSPLDAHPLQELAEIVSDPYRPPPANKKEERHHGVDFSYYRRGERMSIEGVGVQSILAGVVVSSLPDSFPYGNLIIIETPGTSLPAGWAGGLGITGGESLYVLYAHLQGPPQAGLGEAVRACQPLGKVGMSGNAGIAHLHLETRTGPPGESLAHMRYYRTDSTLEERQTYERWRTSGVFRHFDPMRLFNLGL